MRTLAEYESELADLKDRIARNERALKAYDGKDAKIMEMVARMIDGDKKRLPMLEAIIDAMRRKEARGLGA